MLPKAPVNWLPDTAKLWLGLEAQLRIKVSVAASPSKLTAQMMMPVALALSQMLRVIWSPVLPG